MAALVCMPCMYWQRAVILLHTFMFFDVVLGFLQVYTINQKYQRDLMYVLQSYVVEPASVRSESNSFFSSLLQHAHTSTCTGAFLSIVPFA